MRGSQREFLSLMKEGHPPYWYIWLVELRMGKLMAEDTYIPYSSDELAKDNACIQRRLFLGMVVGLVYFHFFGDPIPPSLGLFGYVVLVIGSLVACLIGIFVVAIIHGRLRFTGWVDTGWWVKRSSDFIGFIMAVFIYRICVMLFV